MTQHSSTTPALRTIIAPLAALALLTAAGCGGDGSANDSTAGSVAPSATASHSPSSDPSGDESTAPDESDAGGSEAASSGDASGDGGNGSGEEANSGGANDGDTSGSAGSGGPGGGAKPPAPTLAGTDPCELLTEAQRDELGLPRTTANKRNGETRSCEFNPPQGNGPGTSALLAIHEEQGLNEFSGMTGEAEKTTITGHEAKIQCEYGNCLIGIAVTDTSRVDVQSTVLGDDAATKKLGNRIAKMIIGNLGSS
ncbi:Protein of unknown function [Actinopolyspora mzabensis]|uniref:DUF3558 domain-containing protein n=1 Tax=Actinopolyspora mzabensis TaxID=995066 RepID=A0A1G8X3R7_ACTMZ|nr:DUF3558 family protein [Actinopolyspora mzabensis]SDJ85279.1 Protein of unknown function [Actinopolyspora mzabensis]